MAKQYDFIQQEKVNGVRVELRLIGQYTDEQNFDMPDNIIQDGVDITDAMNLAIAKSIGFGEWLEERIADHIVYLMETEPEVTSDEIHHHQAA